MSSIGIIINECFGLELVRDFGSLPNTWHIEISGNGSRIRLAEDADLQIALGIAIDCADEIALTLRNTKSAFRSVGKANGQLSEHDVSS